MLETIAKDVGNIIETVFFRGDIASLLIAFASVLIAALLMRRQTQIGAMTLLGLVLFVIFGYVRGVFRGGGDSLSGATVGNRVADQIEVGWGQFMNMQAGTLLAYFIAFMLLIFVLFALKSLFSRG